MLGKFFYCDIHTTLEVNCHTTNFAMLGHLKIVIINTFLEKVLDGGTIRPKKFFLHQICIDGASFCLVLRIIERPTLGDNLKPQFVLFTIFMKSNAFYENHMKST